MDKLTSSGSDICTCRPYLIYGIEEAVKTAQRGGVGLIVYFRKEGRALGEVTKCKPLLPLFFNLCLLTNDTDLVYNSRKRGGDSADRYFKATEMIAGVKDMRFQAIMPDTLHWLGVQKIDNMISMVCLSSLLLCFLDTSSGFGADIQSDMKYNAIVDSGIPILKRYDIPDHLIPPVRPPPYYLISRRCACS